MTAAKTSPLEGGEEQWEGRKEIEPGWVLASPGRLHHDDHHHHRHLDGHHHHQEPGWVLASPGRLWMRMIRLILAIQHHHH